MGNKGEILKTCPQYKKSYHLEFHVPPKYVTITAYTWSSNLSWLTIIIIIYYLRILLGPNSRSCKISFMWGALKGNYSRSYKSS